MSKSKNTLGSWAFLIGVVIAVILGIFVQDKIDNSTVTLVLVAIGLIVGFLNVTGNEAQAFLLSGVVLIIATAFGSSSLGSVAYLDSVMEALLKIFVPATIIVAIKNVFSIARN
ncbi:MAG: hypothetical protein AABW81_00430 [Nanoarchaeota archaeon]